MDSRTLLRVVGWVFKLCRGCESSFEANLEAGGLVLSFVVGVDDVAWVGRKLEKLAEERFRRRRFCGRSKLEHFFLRDEMALLFLTNTATPNECFSRYVHFIRSN
jgi:hypothetical protein